MSLFRRSSAAVVSAAVASTSRPPSARLLASLPVVCPNRSRLDQASTSRSFSCSLASTYPRAQRPQPRRLSEFEREPNESTRTTRTVEYEPESEPIEDDIHAPVAASEPKASKPPAKRQVVKELPAKLNENQVVESGEVLSRKKFQKYSKTHVFCRHLPHGVDNQTLKQAFIAAGIPVTCARIIAWPRTDGRFVSRGYGWVTLERERDMRDALRLDGMRINDIPIQIEQMRQRPSGSYDRPPKPEPEMPPGYYDRLPPRNNRRRIDEGSTGYGVRADARADTIALSPNATAALRRMERKQSKAVNNKLYGPRPGDRESDVDWAGWQGPRRGGSREEAEFVVPSARR